MRFDIITLFPELFEPFLSVGVTRRAYQTGQVQVNLWQLRDFAPDTYKRVDERPFGGGPGMVMQPQLLLDCLQQIQQQRQDQAPVILFSPVGQTISQRLVSDFAGASGAILICGRYEGIDQRFIDTYVDQQISLGDFVLSGGEIAAMAFLDAIARLQSGVLNSQDSHHQDSFNDSIDGLLDCPHYTRPKHWQQQPVPAVLLSGNHAAIAQWRRQQQLKLSQQLRPDLIVKARQQQRLTAADEKFLRSLA